MVELGLIYACRGDYPHMAEALMSAVEVANGRMRAYLGERSLVDVSIALAQDVCVSATNSEDEALPALIDWAMLH